MAYDWQVSGEEWSECARGGNAVKAVKGDALLFYRCCCCCTRQNRRCPSGDAYLHRLLHPLKRGPCMCSTLAVAA